MANLFTTPKRCDIYFTDGTITTEFIVDIEEENGYISFRDKYGFGICVQKEQLKYYRIHKDSTDGA